MAKQMTLPNARWVLTLLPLTAKGPARRTRTARTSPMALGKGRQIATKLQEAWPDSHLPIDRMLRGNRATGLKRPRTAANTVAKAVLPHPFGDDIAACIGGEYGQRHQGPSKTGSSGANGFRRADRSVFAGRHHRRGHGLDRRTAQRSAQSGGWRTIGTIVPCRTGSRAIRSFGDVRVLFRRDPDHALTVCPRIHNTDVYN